ncbi:TDT family transporter [Streptomyces fuscigenes]|uniref:SLAC1 family transporter n=1 Tax=Streptomyces fuscigenes TaxID=1528880 RepID=UPI001F2BB266|nr:TDT family transporter [Streptomyces fuscigenes]MCF3961880.1 TDT family transporter [Streptomyces fuscigenes]
MAPRRIPLNLFGMAFGLAGLGGSWIAAARTGDIPVDVGRALLALAALVWLLTLAAYARYALAVRGAFLADLRDPVLGPFSSLAVITPMLLSAEGLNLFWPGGATVFVDVFLGLTVVLGGWLTGQWIYGEMDLATVHPGYFLPTVAGGLIASASATQVHQVRLGEFMLGLGAVCWLIVGSVILVRLLGRPLPAPPLLPTVAIEVAPAPVATLAWFGLNGDRMDAVVAGLAGYGVLMVVAQLRLIAVYRKLPFVPGFWSFTFSWAAVATVTIRWIELGRPAGHLVWTCLVLAAITVLVGSVAVRTCLALARRDLLPPRPAADGAAN